MKLSALLPICLLLLSACGGGGSSSDNNSSGTNQFNGTFIGTSVVDAMVLGQSIQVTGPITVIIEDGNVIYEDVEGNRVEVPIDEQGQFNGQNTDTGFTGNESLNNCEGMATLDGETNGEQVSGVIEGSGSCVLSGETIPVTYTTTFTATKQ